MAKFKIYHCKLDLTANIIDFNDNFSQLFNTKEETQLTFREVFSLSPRFLDDIEHGETKSFIFFCNSKVNNAIKNNSLLLMYIAVEKNHNSYTMKIINWLNWLYNINGSIEKAYSLISEFSNYTQLNNMNILSDTALYKDLQPFLTYLPNNSSNNINQISLQEIMRSFISVEEMNHNSDSTQTLQNNSTINLKNAVKLSATKVADLFKNGELVDVKLNDEIHIPYTTLIRNMVAPIEHDTFLLSIINAIH